MLASLAKFLALLKILMGTWTNTHHIIVKKNREETREGGSHYLGMDTEGGGRLDRGTGLLRGLRSTIR